MPPRIDRHWRYHDLRALVLENARLRLTILPEVGAKLYELVDKRADRQLLWHNPRLEPRLPVFGQNFDDWWSGGWDEVFPTCDVSQYGGESYPYLGELWSLPWSWAIDADASSRSARHAGALRQEGERVRLIFSSADVLVYPAERSR